MKSSGVCWEFSSKNTSIWKKWQVFKTLLRNISTDFYQRPCQFTCRAPWLPEYMTSRRLYNTFCIMKWIEDPCCKDCLVESMTHEHTLGAGSPWLVNSLLHHKVLNSLSLLQENWKTEGSLLTLPLLSALEIKQVWFGFGGGGFCGCGVF